MSEQPLIDATQEKILSLADETKFAANGIVSRTLLRTANSRVVLFGFAAGQELTEHTSTQHAVIQILSGECKFSLAGRPHVAKAGDLIYMPPQSAARGQGDHAVLHAADLFQTGSAAPCLKFLIIKSTETKKRTCKLKPSSARTKSWTCGRFPAPSNTD